MKPAIVLAPIAIGLAGVLYFVFRPSDESRIKAQIDKLAAVVHVTEDDAQTNPIGRLAHVNGALEHLVDHDVRVNVPELPPFGDGRAALGQLITAEPRFVRTLDVDVSHVDIKLDEPHTSALVGLSVRVRGVETTGRTREDSRAVDLRFAKQDGDWLVTTITVWAPGDARPE